VAAKSERLQTREGIMANQVARALGVGLGLPLALFSIAVMFATSLMHAEEVLPDARIEATVPRFGDGMGVGFDSVWIMGTESLARIRIKDNSVIDIPMPDLLPHWIDADTVVGEGAVWVPDADHSVIYKIDPASDQVARKITAYLTPHAESLGVGEGAVWAICGNGDTLKRFDAVDGHERAAITLPARGYGVLVAFGAVWVTSPTNDELYRINPASNGVTASVELSSGPRFMTASEGSVWVPNDGDGSVQRIDPASGKVVASIPTGAPGMGTVSWLGQAYSTAGVGAEHRPGRDASKLTHNTSPPNGRTRPLADSRDARRNRTIRTIRGGHLITDQHQTRLLWRGRAFRSRRMAINAVSVDGICLRDG
jgi:virginiamycin B lyase